MTVEPVLNSPVNFNLKYQISREIQTSKFFILPLLMYHETGAQILFEKIFKFMSFIFLVFLYNFSSGLVIYWTTQNILTIIQQKMIHSKKELVEVDDSRVQNAQSINAKVSNLKKKSRN